MSATIRLLGTGRADALEDHGFSDTFGTPSGVTRDHAVGAGLSFSLAVHGLILAALALVPLLEPVDLPEPHTGTRVVLFAPPPPPLGGALAASKPPNRILPQPQPTALVAPPEQEPTQVPPTAETLDPNPHPKAVAEGMPEGADGGIVGGVPEGMEGGVLGGTGDEPVLDFDRGPRVLKQTRPRYPPEALVKRVEGTVVLEILIDAAGRVVRVSVTHSFPLLDAAAIETVREWVFAPAIKGGHPVATLALAPVTFTIH